MNFIELPYHDSTILVNTGHVMVVSPFDFRGNRSIMIVLDSPLDGTGQRKINIDMAYEDFKALVE